MALKTDAAESSEISCSPLRPPKRMPTRNFFMTFQCGAWSRVRQSQGWFRGSNRTIGNKASGHQSFLPFRMFWVKRKRPLFVTFLSAFLIFWGGGIFLALLFNSPISIEMDLSNECGVTGAVWRSFGLAGLRALIAPLCVGTAITGIGLWRLLPWARTVFMVLCGLDVCLAIGATVEMFWKRSCTSVTFSSAFLCALLLFYFSRKKIKALYRPFPMSSESAT